MSGWTIRLVNVAAAVADRGGDHMDWGDGGTWAMVVIMVLFGLAIVGVLAWAVAGSRQHQQAGPAAPSAPTGAGLGAREILDRRFARGEIDAVEYEERRRLLE